MAHQTELTASDNLMKKIDVLKWALGVEPPMAGLIAHQLLKVVPQTRRQFNLWNSSPSGDGAIVGLPAFSSNGPITLKKSGHEPLVDDLIKAVRLKRAREPRTKLITLAAKSRDMDEAMLVRDIALKELEIERSITEKLTELLEVANRKLVSLESKAKEILEDLREENKMLRTELGVDSSIAAAKAHLLLDEISKVGSRKK